MGNMTVLEDEYGVLREYREVKRKANVGERIKIVSVVSGLFYGVGEIGEVTEVNDDYVLPKFQGGVEDGIWAVGHTATDDNRYVVLEPTDIVIIDGVRYREERRKAAVGERVLIVNPYVTDGKYDRGDVLTIVEYGSAGFPISNAGITLMHDEYVVLTPIDAPKAAESAPQVINVNLTVTVQPGADVAQAVADAVERELTKMNAQEFVSYASDLLGLGDKRIKSPQEIRDEIVERAKRDVADLFVPDYDGGKSVDAPGCGHCRVKFVVNREKRTVVALLERTYEGGIYSRGKAKCAPGDVFNSHIGRAIALRRALGLPVPDEYLNAPQPTEVRAGDRVETPVGEFTTSFSQDTVTRQLVSGKARIIDDSREETEVSA